MRCVSLMILVALLLDLTACSVSAQEKQTPAIRHLTVPNLIGRLERDPNLSFKQPKELFPTGLREVWLLALAHDESETRQLAARSIVIAHRGGLKDWDAAKPLLLGNLSDSRRNVRLATAEAMVELEMRGAAEALAKAADQDGLDMSRIVEPALADWGFRSREKVWLTWLNDPARDQGRARLAMRCFAKAANPDAIQVMRKLVAESPKASLRFAAARSLGAVAKTGLEPLATSLAAEQGAGPQAIPRILAAVMLGAHDSPESLEILSTLIDDAEAEVIAAAAAQLLTRDPVRIVERGHHILVAGDANSRKLFVEALAATPNAVRVEMLADRLDDVNPTVRVAARERLLELSTKQADLRATIVQQNRRMLATGSWRCGEQSSVLAAELKDVGAGELLVDLLHHPRPEAYVASAWALAELNPKVGLETSLKLCADRFEKLMQKGVTDPTEIGVDEQCAFLMQWFGVAKYAPADPLLKECIPKSVGIVLIRRGAVWGLGHMHAGKPQPQLVRKLIERLEDVDSPEPEDDGVRMHCAIAVGRMNSKPSADVIKKWRDLEGVINHVGAGSAWALNQLTGEPIPEVEPEPGYRSGFFLERATKK